jgi:16S rRNA (cytosine1402-N4)-methyltransferase
MMTTRSRRSTPAGEHRPVLLDEVLEVLGPKPGEVAVDCTLGLGGHSRAILERIGPSGRLVGLDWDADNLAHARVRLATDDRGVSVHHSNFAGLLRVLASERLDRVDLILADLGMSSMQVDDAERGFSYVRDGPLDMRMDRSRGRSAQQILATIPEQELSDALRQLGDEPHADRIAHAIVSTREQTPIARTLDLCRVIGGAVGQATTRNQGWRLRPSPGKWSLHPAARTFQALRMLVNRELPNLQELLRVLPQCLAAGGRAAIISFHSGEDRLVKAAFRQSVTQGLYRDVADSPIRASETEKRSNPRSRSAKLRWVTRA